MTKSTGVGRGKGSGGKRPGAGRPKRVFSQEEFIEEVFRPALHAALKEDRTNKFCQWRFFNLSKTHLRVIYGPENLKLFSDIFTQVARGGISKDGIPYTTRWELKLGAAVAAQHLLKQFGKSAVDLDDLGFPTEAMKEKIRKYEEERMKKSKDMFKNDEFVEV